MKNKSTAHPWKIQASADTVAKLQAIADSLGGSVSPNGIAAMAVFEIAQVRPADVWLALGAIRQFNASGPGAAVPELQAPNPAKRLPAPGPRPVSR